MNSLELKGKWNQVKGDLKKKYASLTDDDLKAAEGEYDKLVGILQEKTGKGKEEVEKELQSL
ncbi:CsbD family protein [Neptunitalea lumnitzerae]|uniref:CsbD family protein n=1 Tax=Neptunitalea lumnitzerae TaxID=2965509 RepID=A0ABQ5MGL4_9FLAO|nr:CsbD family protein [Neptunitalea sp. Y10]GLB48576.1 CsbD family protein [Neptunitalea sp. Y10]